MSILKSIVIVVTANLIINILVAKANDTESIVEKLYNQLTNK